VYSLLARVRWQAQRWKEAVVSMILDGYDTDVEPPLSSSDENTTVSISISVLCATPVGEMVSIEAWMYMVRTTSFHCSCST